MSKLLPTPTSLPIVYPLRWGHCPTCERAVPEGVLHCADCLTRATTTTPPRREQARQERGFAVRLAALVWFLAVVGPTCEYGTTEAALWAGAVGFGLVVLARAIECGGKGTRR